jgi:diguanylate cyclase (GGDEF)-like protein/PAS domain S-box-containing protein
MPMGASGQGTQVRWERARDPGLLRQVVDLLPQLVYALEPDGRIHFANERFADFLHTTVDALEGAWLDEVMPPRIAERIRSSVTEVLDGGEAVHGREDLVTGPDGRQHFLRSNLIPFSTAHTGRPAVLGVSTDVTSEVVAVGRLSALSRFMPDVAIIVEHGADRVFVSNAVEELLGWSAEAWLDLDLDEVVHPDDLPHLLPLLESDRTEPGTRGVVEARLGHRDGTWRWCEVRAANLADEPSIRGTLLFARDISARREHDRRLRHQATHDPLTGLLNRSAVVAELERALAEARLTGATVGVLFCDLDNFKLVNDGLGHDVGDHLLHRIAARSQAAIRSEDLVGRLGGDEFLIVARTVNDEAELLGLADRIALTVAEDLRGTPFPVSLSIGAAVAPAGCCTAADLVRDADAAMYRAKHAGKARVEVFRAEMRERSERRLAVGRALRTALDEDTFEVHYQPVFRHEGGTWRLRALEALARCRDLDGAPLPPAEFIPVAEETGMVARLGRRVSNHAVGDLLRWSDRLDDDVQIWLNLSLPQLDSGDVAADLLGAMERVGMPPHRLGVEVTEATLAKEHPIARAVLEELRGAGASVVLDDYGTGPLGLTALKRASVDVVKIDGALVAGMMHDAADLAIVRSVADLGRALGTEIVAEGVEEKAQLRALTTVGCHVAQGFHLGRPVPSSEVDVALRAWRHTATSLDTTVEGR